MARILVADDASFMRQMIREIVEGEGHEVVAEASDGVEAIEQFKKPGAPAHRALLSSGVIIIEGLNLADAEPGMYEMYCLPLRVAGSDGAPARVVLKR